MILSDQLYIIINCYISNTSESTVDDVAVLIGFTFSTADANAITLSLLRMFDSCSMSSLVLIINPLRLLPRLLLDPWHQFLSQYKQVCF
jgi:hypothetical protein